MKTCFFFFCMMSAFLWGEEKIVSCEKTYIQPSQLYFTEQSFLVNIDHIFVQPASLNVDANGIYFNATIISEAVPGPWQCKRRGCNTWNEEWREYCKQCGYPRGSK